MKNQIATKRVNKMRRHCYFLLLCLGLTLSACSDEGSGNDPEDVNDASDDSVTGDAETDTGDDTIIPQDGSEPTPFEQIGMPCEFDSDCLSEFCVVFDEQDEGFCSINCFGDGDCPDSDETSSGQEYTCETLPIINDELRFACIGDDFCYDPDDDGYGFGPGCPRFGFDCDQTDGTINPGAAERCDTVDRNCNGFIADAVIFDADSRNCIIPENLGQCRPGQNICQAIVDEDGVEVGTEIVCVARIEPGTLTERCNGIDDDCDGVADELDEDIAGVGGACSTGVSDCVDGEFRCDPDLQRLVCVATGEGPIGGGADEPNICDGIDNDCDGTTDENFKNENGVYDQIENCGACNINCVQQLPGTEDDLNVTAFCDVRPSAASCDFECREGFVDADGFDENGCEFAPDADAIYVAEPGDGGDDAGSCGAFSTPCATIARGIARAQATSRTRVRVAAGAFPEAIDVVDGVSILGGHDSRTWTRNTDVFVTTISGSLEVGRDIATIFAENIANPTELSGLTVVGSNADAGLNSIAVLVRNGSANLTISDNQIFAGSGGNGEAGSAGSSGTAGGNGEDGRPSRYIDNAQNDCTGSANRGGSGGQNACGQNVSGGRGGNTDRCADYAQTRPDAPDGEGTGAGDGGVSATDHRKDEDSTICNVPSESGRLNATPGENGSSGSDGGAGNGASNDRGSVSTSWQGSDGEQGASGTDGSGGGGGGAAPNVEFEGSNSRMFQGASGGGGGAGGCAGTGGDFGTAGGASFALFVTGGSAPVVENNLLARGPGGNGGDGGNGGAGGSGGIGGDGGARDTTGGPGLICVEPGREGGDGGRGGNGGGGGGGAGGVSFDIALSGVGGSPNYASTNDFDLEGSVETGGFGGEGGASPSNAGGDGSNGAYGNITTF